VKILVLGADGFIGTEVSAVLAKDNDVYEGVYSSAEKREDTIRLDLLDKATVLAAIFKVKPQIIINCAGVVENSKKAELNIEFTRNLLESAVSSGLKFTKIIICGSAAEYGSIDPSQLPVKEDAKLNAANDYGRSKLNEVKLALEYKQKYNLPIVIARIFNPIGAGMHERMIIPGILRQVKAIKKGYSDTIEVSRRDSLRDYINVKDVAQAIRALALGQTHYDVYNIGSGRSTSNQELIDLVLNDFQLDKEPRITETLAKPEPPQAAKADISRIKSDLGWSPEYTIEDSIKEIANATRRS
jgi:GDP-4-dehydro-6-deoxy-D-mannose reductase